MLTTFKTTITRVLVSIIFTLTLLSYSPASASAESADGFSVFWKQIQYYYNTKNLKAAADQYLTHVTSRNTYGADPSKDLLTANLIVGFFSSAFQDQPDQVLAVAEHAIRKGNEFQLFTFAAAVAETNIPIKDSVVAALLQGITTQPDYEPDAQRDRAIASLRKVGFRDYTTEPISTPYRMDIEWAAFLATGKSLHVRRISDHLEHWLPHDEFMARFKQLAKDQATNAHSKSQIRKLLLAGAAEKSLFVYGLDHLPVIKTLFEIAKDRKGQVELAAKSIIAKITYKKNCTQTSPQTLKCQ